MKDKAKDKKQLIKKVNGTRRRLSELETQKPCRKQTNESIYTTQLEWENIFQAIGQPTVIIDPLHGIIAANQAVIKASGLPLKNILGKRCYEIFHGEDSKAPPDGCPLEKLLSTNKLETVEMEMRAFGGIYLVSCTPIFNEQGHLEKIIHIATDITDRKRMEEALQYSEKRLIQAQTIAHLGSWEIDIENQTMWGSEEACLIYGLEYTGGASAFWLLAEIQKAVHHEDRPGMNSALRALLQENKRYDQEFRIFRVNDGALRVIHSKADLIASDEGTPLKVIGTIEDITDRKQAEEALRKSEEEYRNIFENAVMGVFQSTPDGRYLRANPAGARMYGYESPENIIQSVTDMSQQIYVNPEDRARFRQIMESKGRVESFESEQYRKDGSKIWTVLNSRAVRDNAGRTLYYETTIEDITERKRAELESRASEEKFFKAFHASPSIMAIRSLKDWRFIDMNDAYIKVMGYSREELIGASSRKLNITDLETSKEVRETISKQDFIRDWETKIRTKAGDFRTGVFSAVAIQIGDEPCILTAFQDITERKRAEEVLRENEEKYRLIAENMADVIAVLDMNLRFSYVSPSSLRGRGFTVEETMEQTLDQVLTPESLKMALTVFEEEIKLEASGTADPDRIRNMELEEYMKDGSIIWVEVGLSFLRDKDRKPVAILAATRDITERKKAEDAMRSSEEKFFKAFQASPSLMAIRSLKDGRFLDVNDAYCHVLGYSREELIGVVSSEIGINNPEDAKRARELITKQGFLRNFEGKFRTKTGNIHTGLLSAVVIQVEDEPFFVTFTQDITERKLAEELVRESEKTARAVFDATSDMALLIDKKGTILSLNKAMAARLGKSVDELIGRTAYDFLPPHLFKSRVAHIEEAINYGNSVRFEDENSGSWFDNNIYPIREADGKVDRLAIFIRDITERKKSEEERRRLEERLLQAQKMEAIGTLAGGIAHDFNNILSAILGYTEMVLADHKIDDRQRHYLDQVFKAGWRARDLVKQILAFSRQQEQEQKPVPIAPIIKEGIKLLRSSLPTTIKITQNIKDTSIIVLADPTQIHQVVMNLCTNAAHAMREKGGKLDIQLVREEIESSGTQSPIDLAAGDYAKLTVSDTGHGIDAAIMDRIFDPFFTTKGPREGTGLGLSVVYGIVRDHGGAIDVSSEPGKGTTVTVYFPLIETEELIEEKMPEAIPGGSERILFLDDEEALAELGRTMLASLGYQITSRTSSIETLEAFRANPHSFDLVVTDMTMPNMRGDDLARELLKIRPDIPIILCTGFSEMISDEKARNIGIRQFVMKPISKKDLSKAIRDVLDGQ